MIVHQPIIRMKEHCSGGEDLQDLALEVGHSKFVFSPQPLCTPRARIGSEVGFLLGEAVHRTQSDSQKLKSGQLLQLAERLPDGVLFFKEQVGTVRRTDPHCRCRGADDLASTLKMNLTRLN